MCHFRMASPARNKFRWAIVVPTGRRRIGNVRRTSRRIRVPAGMYPCSIRERLTFVETNGERMERYRTKVIDKDGHVIRYPGRCPKFYVEEEAVRPRGLYDFVDHIEEDGGNLRDGYAVRPIPQVEGNRNGWVSEEEEYEMDPDLESTASS